MNECTFAFTEDHVHHEFKLQQQESVKGKEVIVMYTKNGAPGILTRYPGTIQEFVNHFEQLSRMIMDTTEFKAGVTKAKIAKDKQIAFLHSVTEHIDKRNWAVAKRKIQEIIKRIDDGTMANL